jgi:hypothetical protein
MKNPIMERGNGIEVKQMDTDVGNPLITKANADQYIKLLKKAEATR